MRTAERRGLFGSVRSAMGAFVRAVAEGASPSAAGLSSPGPTSELRPAGAAALSGSPARQGAAWRDPRVIALLVAAALGMVARLVVVGASVGSNDMTTWLEFARQISETSVGRLYDEHPFFNHPPLMGVLSSIAYRASLEWASIRFEWLFKAPMILADMASAALLYRRWSARGARRAALVVALFCCNPVSITITAYHGNTDSLCASLVLLAAVLMDGGSRFRAGAALAASINVKLIPVLLIVPLLACTRSRREALHFLGGLALGVIPFLPFLVWHWPGFYAHVLTYRSSPRVWGLTLLTTQLGSGEPLRGLGVALTKFWIKKGTLAVLAWPVVSAALRRYRRPYWSTDQVAAIALMGFLVLTPGWGIQYLVYPVALLFMASVPGAVWYTTVAGLYAVTMYANLWTGSFPFYSNFFNGQDPGGLFLSGLAWIVSVRVLFDLLTRRAPPAEPREQLGMTGAQV